MIKKRFFRLFLVCILVFNTLLAFGSECDNLKVFTLEDGHKVIIKENHSNPIVIVDTWINTGSINENDKNNGVAHFLEHLFFKGTTNHKRGEFEKILDSKGGLFNAATSDDYTQYYIKIPSKDFETAMDLHSDMLLNIAIPPCELETERKVVIEEIKRSKDNPKSILYKNFNSLIYNVHPYKREVIGTEEIISKISRQEILDFYNEWYQPSNMTTIIVGDVDTQKALALVKKEFNPKKSKKTVEKFYPKEPFLTHPETKIHKGDYNSGYLILGFKTDALKNKKDAYALDLASTILGTGESSRLYQDIKEKKQLATSIGAGNSSSKDDGMFYVSATFEPKNYEKLKTEIISELQEMKTTPVSEVELEKAKNMLEREYIYLNESIESVADVIGYSMTIGKDISYYSDYIKDIEKITPQEIQNSINKYVDFNKMAISVVLPENCKQAANNVIAKHSEVKKAEILVNVKKGTKLQKDVTEKITLKNGIDLILNKNVNNDVIALNIFIKGGSFTEKTPGVAALVADVITKGTKNRSYFDLSQELENSGIVLEADSNDDYFSFYLKSTKQDFNKGFEILKDVMENPEFNNKYVEQSKEEALLSIKRSRDEYKNVAFEEFYTEILNGHPYGTTNKILEKTIPTITQKDLIEHYNKYFTPKNMVVSVSGNFDKQDIINKFSQIKSKENPVIVKTKNLHVKLFPIKKNKTIIKEQETSTSWYIIGWQTDGYRNQKDFLTLKLISSILGGGMSSRLFVNLRENKGLAYEVSSSYSANLDNGVFFMYIGTKPQNLKIVQKDFFTEIEKFERAYKISIYLW